MSNKKTIVVVLAIISLAALAGGYTVVRNHRKTAVPTIPSGVRLTPPTEQEKQQANQNKDTIIKNSAPTPAATGGKKPVAVVVTSANITSVNAYVAGILEDGGTCTAIFSQGSTVVSRTSKGFSNVSYTQCAPITTNLPNSNQWTLVVSYASANAEGTSKAQTL